ncbi:MAG: type II secretion system F family protein [Actinomycetota bacterium]|nr:type II secretion system F family protein [Actinomycetota bacterium]
MSSLPRASMLGALAAVVLGVLPVGASAAEPGPGIDIDHVEMADDGTVSILLGTDRLPAAGTPDLTGIQVTVDGQPVDVTAEGVEAGQVRRTTVLALDVSQSMKGERIEAARAAARAFLAAAPADVQVGLVTFSGRVREVVSPTTDHERLSSVVDGLTLSGGTRVFDAVVHAVRLAGQDGARSVLLLSDGKDKGGGASVTEAAAAAADGGVVVDVVALEQDAADRALLGTIADGSGGEVVEATDPESLGQAFTAQADALTQQVLVRFERPADAAEEVALEVSVPAGATAFTDGAFVALPGAADEADQVVLPEPLVGRTGLLLGAAALGLGLALLLAVILLGRRGPTAAQRQLAAYLGETGPVTADGLRESALAFADKMVKGNLETRLVRRLGGAGLSVTPSEWALIHAGVTVVAGLVAFVFGGPILMLVGLLAGAALPAVFLRFRHARRLRAFGAQLPETLGLIAGGLSAGLSLPQSVDTVVREGHEPMAGELRRALVEQRLGVEIDEALDDVAARMGSEDFAWVVMATRIQREVGGNLAEVLHTVADTLREREYLRRQVHSLSAEGRLSAWIIGLIPVLMFVYMMVANRAYVSMLYTTTTGLMMSAVAVGLLGSGVWAMSRLVKVQV